LTTYFGFRKIKPKKKGKTRMAYLARNKIARTGNRMRLFFKAGLLGKNQIDSERLGKKIVKKMTFQKHKLWILQLSDNEIYI